MKNVLISIKPRFVNEIIKGTKKYEFRRSIFKDAKEIGKVFIYATAPIKKIVASFSIGEIVADHPEALWNRCQSVSGIDRSSFFEYFKNKDVGFAIKIKDLDVFKTPVDPTRVIPGFVAPQSYRYVDQATNIG
jgi:type I restriction enzyme S subunit